MQSKLYYEGHITVDSKDLKYWEEFENLVPGLFKTSRFDDDNVDDYNDKWFMSCRHKDYDSIKNDMKYGIDILESYGYNVIRYKIEDTLLDSKYGDNL